MTDKHIEKAALGFGARVLTIEELAARFPFSFLLVDLRTRCAEMEPLIKQLQAKTGDPTIAKFYINLKVYLDHFVEQKKAQEK